MILDKASTCLPLIYILVLLPISLCDAGRTQRHSAVARPARKSLQPDCASLAASSHPPMRSSAAAALEAHLEGIPDLGPCHHNRSLLEEVVTNAQCSSISCMYSARCNMAYDFREEFFKPLPSELSKSCHTPSGGQVRQPSAGTHVVVSFILPFQNHVTLATQCLLELYRTAAETTSAEFFIVDDASTEDTTPMTDSIKRLIGLFDAPIKLTSHTKALGFGGSCMVGARHASGQYIALINSDTFVSRGWLAVMLATFSQQPKAGLVGPLFLGEGMLVAEGGGLVWADGTPANYFRGEPVRHNVSFMRPVDYITAALVLIKREAFLTVGGLDSRYGRGYFEDTDLAMAFQFFGYQVCANPICWKYACTLRDKCVTSCLFPISSPVSTRPAVETRVHSPRIQSP